MKRLIIGLLGMIFTASAAEYGWLRPNNLENIVGEQLSSTWLRESYSQIKDLVLNEGDSLTFVSFSGSNLEYYSTGPGQEIHNLVDDPGYYWSDGSYTGTSQTVNIKVNSQYVPLESRTLFGPLVIVGIRNDGDYNAQYRINRSTDPDGTEKFSVSLDNDGDRVAVGYKENGTNSVVKVYQFNGSSWNQLGEDIE